MTISCISKNEAQSFFRKFEHLGNCGLGVWHYGVYDKEGLLSVVSFGTTSFNPTRSKIAQFAQDNDLRIIQLNRGGTRYDAPKNSASCSVSLALKSIREKFGDTIIVAYSDTKWNEIGTIYQSCNFLYFGLTNPKGQSNYYIHGKKTTGWAVRKKYGTRNMKELRKIDPNVKKEPLSRKHIYVFFNCGPNKKRKGIKAFAGSILPYPKRYEMNIGSMLEIREMVHKRQKDSI